MKILEKVHKTLKLLAALAISASCSTFLINCATGGIDVKIYGFDLKNNYLYHGQKEKPDHTQALDTTLDEKSWLAITLDDWNYVRQHCAK